MVIKNKGFARWVREWERYQTTMEIIPISTKTIGIRARQSDVERLEKGLGKRGWGANVGVEIEQKAY